MGKIDDSLKKAKVSYDSAVGKLKIGKGNLIRRAEKLKELVKIEKQLPSNFTEE